MTRRLALLLALGAVPIALVVSACGSDDGAEVRRSTGESASPSNPDPASAPGRPPGAGSRSRRRQTAGSGNALVSRGVVAYSTTWPTRWTAPSPRPTPSPTRCGPATRGGQGRLRPLPRGLGAHRADRRPGRGDRRRRRRPGRRLRGRGRPGLHRLAPPRVPPLGEEHHRRAPPPFADQLDDDLQTLKPRAARRSRSRPRPSPSAPPSSSRRSPRARSPARRTATRTPTCGTSPPTSRAPRKVFELLTPALEEADPELLPDIQAGLRGHRGEPRASTRTATAAYVPATTSSPSRHRTR